MRARVPCCRSALGRGADQSPSFAVYAPWIARRLPHAGSGCIVEGLGCRWITLRVPHAISTVPSVRLPRSLPLHACMQAASVHACGFLALCRFPAAGTSVCVSGLGFGL